MIGLNHIQQPRNAHVNRSVVTLSKVIPSDPNLLDEAVEEVVAALNCIGCGDEVENIGLAVGEAIANAIVHGNHCDPQKTVSVAIMTDESGDLLAIVKDSGSGFDPSSLPDPLAREGLRANHGRGIFLVRQFMDAVELGSVTEQKFACGERRTGGRQPPIPLRTTQS
jgi:anti-sigma regulatory factor (Ser/Thr protein kinase)